MTEFIYNAAWTLTAPVLRAVLSARPAYRPLLQRFAPPVPAMEAPPIWVQAVSVGEVRTVRPIVEAMNKRWGQTPTLLTASTLTGHQLARELLPQCPVTWFPFDQKRAVHEFMEKAAPLALILTETELWPNTLRIAHRHNIPVIIVNGRLSDKHYPHYRRIRPLLRPVLKTITLACMQNQEYAERIKDLGVPSDRVHVTGNTKFDGLNPTPQPRPSARLRQENGFPAEDPVIIFASTRPGDEEIAARAWRELKSEFPTLRLSIAPRHPNRISDATAPFNEPILLRSEIKKGRTPKDERVFILDTLGELTEFYSLSTLAVMGGSFSPDIQGHNPLEPAAAGLPTLFGPHMRNFSGPAQILLDANAARQVRDADELTIQLRHLLRHPEERDALARAAYSAIKENQGAIERSLDLIQSVLDLPLA